MKSMNTVERGIYAAVWAKEYDIHDPPKEVCYPDNGGKWEQWEKDQAANAAICAAYAVQRFREAGKEIVDGQGKGSDVHRLYLDAKKE